MCKSIEMKYMRESKMRIASRQGQESFPWKPSANCPTKPAAGEAERYL